MMSVNDTLESVFSAIYHLNRLNCLEYSTWANLKEKLELAIKHDKDMLYEQINHQNATIAASMKVTTQGNGVLIDNLPNNLTKFQVSNKHYFLNKNNGRVFRYDFINDTLENTNLPEKANVVFIEGNTLKAITDKGIYLLEKDNWKLKRTIDKNDNSDYIDEITYIFNNDGNEFDPMKYVYNVYTKKVDVYLNVDNTHPAETIDNVEDFYCSKSGATICKTKDGIFVKPSIHLNPCFCAFNRINLDKIDIVEDMFITDDDIAYFVINRTNTKQYNLAIVNLTDSSSNEHRYIVINTPINISEDYWYRVVGHRVFFCTIVKEDTKYGQCIKPNKLYTVNIVNNKFALVEITDSNKSKYGNYTAEDLFFNNTASEGVK